MKFYTILLAVVLAMDCSNSKSSENKNSASNNPQASNNLQTKETPPEKNVNTNSSNTSANSNISGNNDRQDKEDFGVKIVDDKSGTSQNVHITVNDKPKWIIKMPSFEDINNFAVDNAKKNDKGFEFQVEYGSRYKYDKTFFFTKKGDNFYLTEIKVRSFDGANPEKWSEKTIKIDKQVSLDKFDINKYLSD